MHSSSFSIFFSLCKKSVCKRDFISKNMSKFPVRKNKLKFKRQKEEEEAVKEKVKIKTSLPM